MKTLLSFLLITAAYISLQAAEKPFSVKPDLFNQSKGDDLGLSMAEGTETVVVFSPTDATDHFSNGVVMTGFKGWLYCMWQSSKTDEDAGDTWVAYSRSQDGKNWTAPMVLAKTFEKGYRSSGGWWVNGDTLVAYANVWPSSVSPRGGYVEYTTSTDGLTWAPLQRVLMKDGKTLDGIFEQDPHALPDGRIINAAHFQKGLIASPIYTDDPSGVRGWIRPPFTNLSHSGDITRELEPSWFWRNDGAVVMVFRDQGGSLRRLASVSTNRGESWTTAVVSEMPDSRSKQSAGNLPDSTAYMVGNPVTQKLRIPLAIALSKDGLLFDKAYVLRKGGSALPKLRYSGKAKTAGYSYPKSTVWQGFLYVGYSVNKEIVEYTRIPLSSISLNNPVSVKQSLHPSRHHAVSVARSAAGTVRISGNNRGSTVATLYTPAGAQLCSKTSEGRDIQFSMSTYPCGTYVIAVVTTTGRSTHCIHNW